MSNATTPRLIAFVCAAALAACAAPPPPDTRAADEAVLRRAETDWVAAAQTHRAADWVAFYAPDAAVLPPGEPAAVTGPAISASIAAFLALPELRVTWAPNRVEIARAGDLGYSWGSYQLSYKDAKAKPMRDTGKYVEIWRRQPDGGWKCILDSWNSDQP